MSNEEKRACMDCGGTHGVELRNPGYGYKGYPRCEGCGERRLEREAASRQRYPKLQPADFDPADAGESWDEVS